MRKRIVFLAALHLALCLMAGCAGGARDGILLSGEESSDSSGGDLGEGSADGGLGEGSSGGGSGEGAAGAGSAEESAGGGSGAGAGTIYVQVSGAVKEPGVYELEAGSRIFQALELAGGVTDEADVKGLNQAEPLSDGQMVYIMDKEEARAQEAQAREAQEAQAGEAQDDGRLDLNAATEAELMELPGIGEAKARSILAWREANGRFRQIEDLMKVEGIKEGVFSKVKDCVKVD